jgi:hypothetical protein
MNYNYGKMMIHYGKMIIHSGIMNVIFVITLKYDAECFLIP